MLDIDRFRLCGCRKLIKAIDAYIEKADKGIEQALEDGGYADPERTMDEIRQLEEELMDLMEEDTKTIISSVNDCDDLRDFMNRAWPGLQNSGELVEKLSRTFEKVFSEVIPDFTAEYMKRAESDLTLESVSLLKRTRAWICSWSSRLSKLMKLSDNKVIQGILDKGLREGKGVQQVASEISNSGLRAPGYRSRRVATTELLRAHSVAQQESFMQSPVVESKMWKHSGWRTYARKNHMKSAESGGINGQIVAKDKTFTLVGEDGSTYSPMYPRDPSLPPKESVNCGCVCQPIVNESILGLSLEERNRLRDGAIAELDEEFDRELDRQNQEQAFLRREPEEWKERRKAYIDVTQEYIDNASPGRGIKEIEEGFEESNKEISIMETIHKICGGDIRVLNESSESGVKTADYLWNGKLWDAKTVEREISANTAIKRGLKQIKDNPGGVILNYEDRTVNMNKLIEVIRKRMGRGYDADIIIMQNDNITKVLRFRK